VFGIGKESQTASAGFLVRGVRQVWSSTTCLSFDIEKALACSVLTDATPWMEAQPLERAHEVCKRMKSGQARYHMVPSMRHAHDA